MAEEKKVRILSLDGGGIRGVIPATVVAYIEKKIREEKGDEKRIADYFDMIVGTSTGGLLTGFYLKPNPTPTPNGPLTAYEAEEALKVYTEEGFNIFNASKKRMYGLRQFFNATQFDPTYLESTLKKHFTVKEEDGTERDLMMHELVRPCTVTTYNMNKKSSLFLRSTDVNRKDGPRTYKVWEALRSTSAAPTYFPPAEIHNYSLPVNDETTLYNLDGGVFANNPTMCAYSEARNMKFPERGVDFPSANQMLILSIGTGGGNFALGELSKSPRWDVLKWAKSIPNIMMDGSIDTTDYQMRQIYDTLNKVHQDSYLRIDVEQHDRKYETDMADASPENIKKLKLAGQKTVDHYKKHLDSFIKRILD
ncbi:MAG: patatin-like phospholipase family protein [bacterium]|nr:patatin-like phospholipase family protein [bacterium]